MSLVIYIILSLCTSGDLNDMCTYLVSWQKLSFVFRKVDVVFLYVFFDPKTYFEQDECPVSLAYVFCDLKMGGEKSPIPSS